MDWKITDYPEAVVVELQSNSVNRQNPEYYADLHRAFDLLDANYPLKPAILTAAGKVFSAGIDLNYAFPLFTSGDSLKIDRWYEDYKKSMLRVLTSKRLTIAALNGHAFAGGMILALCCDYRMATNGDFRYALNEVPIGIPMPSVYTEIVRYRLGDRRANEAILFGKTYKVEEAQRIGFIDEITYPDGLIPNALAHAGGIPQDCWAACAQSKLNLIAPTLKRIAEDTPALEKETLKVLASPASLRAQRETVEKLRSRTK